MASLDIAFGGVHESPRYIECLECATIAEKCKECGDYVCVNKHVILKNLNYKYRPCDDPFCNGKESEIRESNYPNLRKPKWTKPVLPIGPVAREIGVPIGPLEAIAVPIEPLGAIAVPIEPVAVETRAWWKRIFCCCL
jgi:hypothetical protein